MRAASRVYASARRFPSYLILHYADKLGDDGWKAALMAVIRFKTNILCEDKPDPGSSWMMWADNHAKRRYLDATRLSIATYVCFVPCMDMCVFYICIYYYIYIYIQIYMTWTPRERLELRALTAPAIFPAAGADQNFRYRLDIMTRSRNYWILRRTAGYIAIRDLKGKKKRSARIAHAVARKSTVASHEWERRKRSAEFPIVEPSIWR